MKLNELTSLLLKETFHSFEIGDEFTQEILADIAFYTKVSDKGVMLKEMKSKATKFIQSQIKVGNIEKVVGVKDGRYQVYKKVSNLLEYKTLAVDPIPKEYMDFVSIWNELNVGDAVTAKDFFDILDEQEIDITYEGQSSKFLWIISDRGLAECQINQHDPKKNTYVRIDSIPESVLFQKTTKFMKVPCGEYQSRLDQI